MGKHKKEVEENYIQRDVEQMFKVKEWAVQEGLDPLLYKYWENQMMTKEEFEKLKMEQGA